MIEWLRPEWLLALPAGLALAWLWWRSAAGLGPWRRAVDPALLEALGERAPARGARLALALGLAAFVLACVALAGPSWRTQPVALEQDAGARIVVLDLSPSMDAVDLAPTRLERAREAAAGLLAQAGGAQLGLVVFGADAFSVAPLTADPALLAHLIPGLHTRVLPRAGSRPDLGLALARELLGASGAAAGEVILVGDSAGDARTLAEARALARAGFPVSVLAVGTAYGGPVRVGQGAFARTAAGDVLIARAELEALERVAAEGGGRFRLLPAKGPAPRFERSLPAEGAARAASAEGGAPQDDGAWLALLALPFAALLFRRGWLMGLAALALNLALPAPPALALDWADLWRRPEQQAARAFAERRAGDAEARLADKLDRGSSWRAMLLYRVGRYAEAEALFAERDTAVAHYNRGNALALAGRLEAALSAYDEALERRPGMRDALANRALVREAMRRQRAQGGEGGDPASPGEAQGSEPSPREGARAEAGRREPAREGAGREDAQEAREAAQGAAADGGEGPDAAELRRLAEKLARVEDDTRSLLANRFERQLRDRGAPDPDTGAPW